jgi:hypothetical protein
MFVDRLGSCAASTLNACPLSATRREANAGEFGTKARSTQFSNWEHDTRVLPALAVLRYTALHRPGTQACCTHKHTKQYPSRGVVAFDRLATSTTRPCAVASHRLLGDHAVPLLHVLRVRAVLPPQPREPLLVREAKRGAQHAQAARLLARAPQHLVAARVATGVQVILPRGVVVQRFLLLKFAVRLGLDKQLPARRGGLVRDDARCARRRLCQRRQVGACSAAAMLSVLFAWHPWCALTRYTRKG